ncbi:MAG TPA: hypothetical protein VM869_14785 [Enhygromyxa sp.]|nr:hypothetical protein [Enhygromyxa sp.]
MTLGPIPEPAARRVARLLVAVAFSITSLACARGMRSDSGIYVPPIQPVWASKTRLPSYHFGSPGLEWVPLTEKGLQVAWRHDSDPAVIQVFGECGIHGDSDLEDFVDHQRIDYSAWAIVEEPTGELDAEGRPRMRPKQYYTTIANREALRTTVRANLDGVEVMIEYVVVKKDGCLFDLTYIAKPEDFEQHTPAFQKVIDGFGYPVRR